MSRLWSESQEKLFTELWDQGLEPAVIGNRMAEVGRPLAGSSVVDRAKRMQLKPRRSPPRERIGGWPEKAKKEVSRLWGEGYSATQIACRVSHLREGHVTRNMIISLVHRMGLSKRKAPKALKYTKPKSKTAFGHEKRINSQSAHMVSTPVLKKKKTQPLPKPRKADKDRIGPTLEQLTRNSCRWPVGVDAGGEQMFCGCKALHPFESSEGQPYCAEHMARSKSSMSAEQRQQLSDRMKAHHQAKKAHNLHDRKKAA